MAEKKRIRMHLLYVGGFPEEILANCWFNKRAMVFVTNDQAEREILFVPYSLAGPLKNGGFRFDGWTDSDGFVKGEFQDRNGFGWIESVPAPRGVDECSEFVKTTDCQPNLFKNNPDIW